MNVEKEIYKIVSEIVDIQEDMLNPDASFMDEYELDSLRVLEILAAIENKFNITINPERFKEMTTLNNVIKIAKDYI